MTWRRRRVFRMPRGTGRDPDVVEEEVRFHLERKVERLKREGMSEDEAWAEARRRFGDVDRVKSQMRREGSTAMKWLPTWDRIGQDAHFAFRQVVRNPGFSAVAALTLALGVGATTAIFSVVDGILFRPLPFPEPDELVAVWADWSRQGGPADEWMNFPNFFDLKERSRTLEAVAAWDGGSMTLTGLGEPEQVTVGTVSHDMISDVLRISPALGRGFDAEDDRPGAEATVLLTDGFWRRAFGSDSGAVGATLSLNDVSYTIIGVLPADFQAPFMTNADVWTPLRQDRANNYCGRGGACVLVVGRRRSESSLEEARTEAAEIARQLEEEYPEANTNTGLTLIPLRDDMVAQARTGLLLLLAAAGVVMLIACVNVANLLMARATARSSELAVRSALGAGRGRITGQLLTESALLATLGGGAGLALAFLGTDLLVSMAPPGTPRIEGVAVNARVLAFSIGVSALSGLIFGVVPALRSSGGEIDVVLRTGGRGGTGRRGGVRARGLLIAGQVALALVLLIGAGLLVRSFQNLRSEDLGFQPEGVLTFDLVLPSSRYPDAEARRAFVVGLEDRLSALPGVEAVGTTSWLPLTGFGSDTGFNIEGRPLPPTGQGQGVWFRRVTPGYPDAMGMRLVAGRWIDDTDDASAPLVVVINDGFARRHFPDENPLGKRINMNSPEEPRWREIVGVAVEVRYFGIRGDSRDALYLPYHQSPSTSLYVTLRATRDLTALAGEVRGVIAQADPALAAGEVRPMESVVADSLGPDRLVTLLTSLFAAVALLLAVIGLYGVVSYAVSQRLREMGVRVALGAQGGEIRRLVFKQGLTFVGSGLFVGIIGGLGVTRLMENLLFGISPGDPWTYATVGLMLTAVATAASALPARRAARVDPIEVLRAE